MATVAGSSSVLDELFPAVVQCFTVTFAGYMAGRLNVISGCQGRGIEIYVGKFALPSLIFLSLATLDFSSVDWNFFYAVLISKCIVFFTVFAMSSLLTRPSHLSISALFAIFCTQSNDFAMGYPIISALYDTTHPEFVDYLYLVAPVSLCLLNPFGFFCMELWKRRLVSTPSAVNGPQAQPSASIYRILLASVRGVITNPIVVMTALGVVGNLVLAGHPVPRVLFDILNTFGQSFSATALFVLGLRLANGADSLSTSGSASYSSSSPSVSYVVPLILITIKSVIMPLVVRQTISILQDLGTDSASNFSVDMTNYAFIYGILPTAPSVLVYATQYQVAIQVVASALVIGTFLSTPLMFVSAWVVSLYATVAPANYIDSINLYLADISMIGLACCLWVLSVFVVSGKFRRVPHFLTFCLVISQSVACIGAILSTYVEKSNTPASFYLRFMPRSVGVFCSRVWTALISVALVLIQRRSLCYVLRCRLLFMAVGWAFPAVLTVALLATNGGRYMYEGDPGFELGEYQSIPAIVILSMSLLVTLTCLVLHHRSSAAASDQGQPMQESPETSDLSLQSSAAEESDQELRRSARDEDDDGVADLISTGIHRRDTRGSNVAQCSGAAESAGSRLTCDSSQPCYPGSRHECRNYVRNYFEEEGLELADAAMECDQLLQVRRHVTLLMLLVLSMVVGLFLSVWNLFMEKMVGVYAVVDFIDGALNFGQGVFVFALFGLDNELVVEPLVRWWRRLLWGQDTLHLPESADLSPETRHICDQFKVYHLDQCRRDLVRDARCRLRLYRHVFTGAELVDWLIRVGLASDRGDALRYGRHLVEGRVLRHYRQQHHFMDRPIFYQLTNDTLRDLAESVHVNLASSYDQSSD